MRGRTRPSLRSSNNRMLGAAAAFGAAAGALLTYLALRLPRKRQGEGAPIAADPSPVPDILVPFVRRYGLPALDTVILPYEEFSLCFDSRTRTPKWVLEKVSSQSEGGRSQVSFFEETRLDPHLRSRLADYRNSGYDRGHMAAAADHKTSQEALKETFTLANVCPQVGPGFNRSYWRRLEEFVRRLAGQFDAVYVITGPLFVPSRTNLSRNDSNSTANDGSPLPQPTEWELNVPCLGRPPRFVAVPTHFYKLIVVEQTRTVGPPTAAVAAFVLPNAPIPAEADLRRFIVPLELLTDVAGIKFLAGLVDEEGRALIDAAALAEREKAAETDHGQTALPLPRQMLQLPRGGAARANGNGGVHQTGFADKQEKRENGGNEDSVVLNAFAAGKPRFLCELVPCRLAADHVASATAGKLNGLR